MRIRSVQFVVPLALLLLAAGCLSGTPGAETRTGTPTPAEPTTTPTLDTGATATRCPAPATGTPTSTVDSTPSTATSKTPTATVSSFEFSSDSETPVHLRNRWDRRVDVRIRVVCVSTNATVHDETVEVFPGGSTTVYDLAEADPGGGVPLRVVVTARNETGNVTVRTTACADVTGEVGADGDLQVWATC